MVPFRFLHIIRHLVLRAPKKGRPGRQAKIVKERLESHIPGMKLKAGDPMGLNSL